MAPPSLGKLLIYKFSIKNAINYKNNDGAIKEQSFNDVYSCRKLLEICFSVNIINFTFFINI